MAPVRVSHSAYQLAVGHLMESMRSDGKGLAECAIHTHGGTKVADVAPEVCVEVFSPGNTDKEMHEKRELYFETDAEEVWYCDEDGRLSFFDVESPRSTSRIFPEFSQNIEL